LYLLRKAPQARNRTVTRTANLPISQQSRDFPASSGVIQLIMLFV
jgi:hypothetical protein